MGRLMLLSGACLLALGTTGAPALAKADAKAEDSTCHLKSYSYLVGENITETRNIGADFRLLEAGRAPGPAQPKRLTIVYDSGSERVVSVSCG